MSAHHTLFFCLEGLPCPSAIQEVGTPTCGHLDCAPDPGWASYPFCPGPASHLRLISSMEGSASAQLAAHRREERKADCRERPEAEPKAGEGVLPGFLVAICPWTSGDTAVSTHFPHCLTQLKLITCNRGLNLVSTKVLTKAKREPDRL